MGTSSFKHLFRKAKEKSHLKADQAHHASELESELKMGFHEHLIELRTRLIRSLIALIVCFFITFHFIEEIVQFLVQPILNLLPENERFLI